MRFLTIHQLDCQPQFELKAFGKCVEGAQITPSVIIPDEISIWAYFSGLTWLGLLIVYIYNPHYYRSDNFIQTETTRIIWAKIAIY